MYQASLVAQMVESACKAGYPGSIPGSGRSPEEGNGNPLQYSYMENSHGWRSLAGYTPWGGKESDTTEQLTHMCTRHCAMDMHPPTSPQLIISLSNVYQCLINCSTLCDGIQGPQRTRH